MKNTQTARSRYAGIWMMAALLAGPTTVIARDDGYQGRALYQTAVRYRDHDDRHDRNYRGSRHHYKEHKHRYHGHRHGYGHYARPIYPRHHHYHAYPAPRYYSRGYGLWDFSLNYRYYD